MGERGNIEGKVSSIMKGFIAKIDNIQLLALRQTATELINEISVPVQTHNLWDSIGCGIYNNGALVEVFFPIKEARVPRDGIWGREQLEDFVVNNPPSEIRNINGWALYYVASMPYAQAVDDRDDVDILLEEAVVPTFIKYINL